MSTIEAHRKLIDIDPSAFAILSEEAMDMRVSLKKYIESLLLEESARIKRKKSLHASDRILSLIGSAKPLKGDLYSMDDDRLQYILSK